MVLPHHTRPPTPIFAFSSAMAPTHRNRSRPALIPMKPDYKAEDVEYIKHRRSTTDANGNTEQTELRVPKLKDESTTYQIIEFFAYFCECRCHMHWTTGPKLFQKFLSQLEGDHSTSWTVQVAGIGETVVNFDAQHDVFKTGLLSGCQYHDQMDFLRTLRKSVDQTPTQFLRALRAAESRAAELPDAPANPGFSEMERKRVFYLAMPNSWQEKFDDANMRLEDEVINNMRLYFDQLYTLYS
jgi:hypothetical protein